MARKYYKRNFEEALKGATPSFYEYDDLSVSSKDLLPTDHLINSHIEVADSFNSLIQVSATANYPDVDTFEGITQFFLPHLKSTNVSPEKFSQEILQKFGKTFDDYATSAEFLSGLQSDVLPYISLNNPSAVLFDLDSSGAHEFLLRTLGWAYILNSSSVPTATDPSTLLPQALTETLYNGETFTTVNGINVLEEYLWGDYTSLSSVNANIVPIDYLSGAGEYVSGTQQLEKLQTLVEIVYGNNSLSREDRYVQDAFEDYSNLGIKLGNYTYNGPFSKLMRVFGYFLADRQVELETLRDLFDISNCPEEYLPNIAQLIGWKLIGTDTSRWRNQLRSAVEVYKSKGTIKSIQLIANSIFGNSVLDVSTSNLQELYESYIPNLILFALATDSKAFANKGENWTPQVAQFLGVGEFSEKGVDVNLRIAVDYILLDLYEKYPDHFQLGSEQFRVGDPDFIFNYRGRDFPMPPWEEEKYYVFCNITPSFLQYLKERLICFGVSESLAEEIRLYIYENTISSTEPYSLESQWVFFTSSIEYPSTHDDVIINPEEKRVEYLPLWNGKSSTVAFPFQASSFDFTKTKTNTPDSQNTLHEVAVGLEQVLPATVIPNLVLSISSVADVVDYVDQLCPTIATNYQDIYEGSSQAFTNYGVSGVDMSPGAKVFKRRDVDENSDSLIGDTTIISVPRNALRRRNFEKLLPLNGHFDRKGFNMPNTWAPSAIEYSCSDASNSCWLPLGYNVSAGKYEPLFDYLNPTGVYSRCSTLQSSDAYFGIDVSTTFPARGRDSYEMSACLEYTPRNLSEDLNILMWSIAERSASKTAEQEIAMFPDRYIDPEWADHQLSTTNEIISRILPEMVDYRNFEFGDNINRLYTIYSKYFSDSGLAERLVGRGDFNSIINHVYGSLLYNSSFEIDGSAISTDSSLISSSLVEINYFTTEPSNVFTDSTYATSIGTTLETETSALIFNDLGEFRNPHILSGVELIVGASSTPENKMAAIRVSYEKEGENRENYEIENSLVYLKSVEDFPRLKFNLRDFGDSNFLLPDNDYQLDLNVFGGRDDGLWIGGFEFGVWIHTKGDNGKFGTLKPDEE